MEALLTIAFISLLVLGSVCMEKANQVKEREKRISALSEQIHDYIVSSNKRDKERDRIIKEHVIEVILNIDTLLKDLKQPHSTKDCINTYVELGYYYKDSSVIEDILNIDVALKELKQPHSAKDCIDIYIKLENNIKKSIMEKNPDKSEDEIELDPLHVAFIPYSGASSAYFRKNPEAKESYDNSMNKLKNRIKELK